MTAARSLYRTLRQVSAHAGRRIEPGWPTALANGAGDRRVFEFLAAGRAAQHEPAAAHVAATDERRWKQEPLTEDRQQHLDVFPGRDAAEQHDVAVGPDAGARARGHPARADDDSARW